MERRQEADHVARIEHNHKAQALIIAQYEKMIEDGYGRIEIVVHNHWFKHVIPSPKLTVQN